MEQDEAEQQTEASPQKTDRQSLLASPEGRLLLAGVTLAFCYSIWLGIKLLMADEDAQILVGMTATHILFGRAACMAYGYSVELGHSTVIVINMILEAILVLIIYPLFVFSYRRLLVVPWLKKGMDKIGDAAESRKEGIRKYGIVGLFFFVWFPFWMTGPVVGSIIGFLLRLRLWVNISVVLGGTFVAIIGWAVFLRKIASHSSFAITAILLILVLIIIGGHFLHRMSQNNKSRKNHNDDSQK